MENNTMYIFGFVNITVKFSYSKKNLATVKAIQVGQGHNPRRYNSDLQAWEFDTRDIAAVVAAFPNFPIYGNTEHFMKSIEEGNRMSA
jgi:protein involved in polysaccharide export with SLBB domain